MLTDNQKKFQEHLLQLAEIELAMAKAHKNLERVDVIQVRVNALKKIINEGENNA